MRILMLGLSHRTADVALREKLSLEGDRALQMIVRLRERFPQAECVVLSTCNRTELYLARPSHHGPSATELQMLLGQVTSVPLETVASVAIHREQEQALRHLFHVCVGLDSMVLGEPQILGQVKRAYEWAIGQHMVGPVLHQVFQRAIATAKALRHETPIGEGRTSVGSVAVEFARRIFSDFSDKTITCIGAGEMVKLTLRHLQTLQPQKVWIINRTLARAVALAEQTGLQHPALARGGARPWEALDSLLVESDIIITCTGATQPLLTAERFRPLLKQRRGRPLLLIDIAVPRDIDPAIGSMRNTYLYNLDDLQKVVEASLSDRAETAQACQARVSSAVAACLSDLQHRDLGALVRQLREQLHTIGRVELDRTFRRLRARLGDQISEESQADAERMLQEHTHRVVNKILHLPLSQLDHHNPDAPLGFYAAALRRLFDLHEEAPPSETSSRVLPGSQAQVPAKSTAR